MNIGLFGISGVGKSYMASAICADNDSLISVKASDILKAYNRRTRFHGLSSNVVSENQKSLIEGFKHFRDNHRGKNIIIELHNIIETPTGEVVIDDSVFDLLELNAVCFLKTEPKLILKQRCEDTSRIRQEISLGNLHALQERSLAKFLKKYERQGIPYIILESTYISQLNKFIKSVYL